MLGRRLILDQLYQIVLEDHLAGGKREVAPDLEFGRIRLADFEMPMPGLDVLGEHVHAAHQIVGIRSERLAKQFRIGEHEIRRRDRVADLLDVEGGLRPRVVVDALGVFDQPLAPLRGEQIGLLEEIEELVLRPFRIGKALVLEVGRGRRRGGFARHALDRAGPQIEIGAAEACLQFERALRIGKPVLRDMADGLDHVGHVFGQIAFDFAFLARLHIGGERLAAFLDQAREILREGLDLHRADLGRFAGRRFCRFGGGFIHSHPVGPRRHKWPGARFPARRDWAHGAA